MRWDRLFADLEQRFDELERAQEEAERADRERVAIGAIRATDRLAGSVGAAVRLTLAGGASITGTLRVVGPDWLLVTEGHGRDALISWTAVTVVQGLAASTAPPVAESAIRLDLRRALRGIARDRSPVSVALTGWTSALAGSSVSASSPGSGELTGTVDRVGADFIEVAVHAAWEPRRAGSVRAVALIPLPSIVLVRPLPLG